MPVEIKRGLTDSKENSAASTSAYIISSFSFLPAGLSSSINKAFPSPEQSTIQLTHHNYHVAVPSDRTHTYVVFADHSVHSLLYTAGLPADFASPRKIASTTASTTAISTSSDNCIICILQPTPTTSDSSRLSSCNHFAYRGNLVAPTSVVTANTHPSRRMSR